MPQSDDTTRMLRQNVQIAGTVLSEVTLNIENTQDYGSLSVKRRNFRDAEVISENSNLTSYLIASDEITLRENELPDVGEFSTDRRKDSSGKMRNDSSSKTEMEKAPIIDGSTQFVHSEGEANEERIVEEQTQNYHCQGCKVIQSELKILTARMRDLKTKYRQCLEADVEVTESLVTSKASRCSSATQTDQEFKDENWWQTYCEELEEQVEVLQEDMAIHIDDHESRKEQDCIEREKLKQELLKTNMRIGDLEGVAEKVEKENLYFLSIIQDIRSKSSKLLDEQKNEIIRSVELNRMAKEVLYRSSQSMESQLELMLKKTCEDNVQLHDHLEKADEFLVNAKLQALQLGSFHHQLEKKLDKLLKKFKAEATSSHLAWIGRSNIQFALDSFEAAVKTILEDDPHFRSLAERVPVFIDVKTVNDNEQMESVSEIREGSSKDRKIAALTDFKRTFSAEVYSLLKEFKKRQKAELAENIWKIRGYLENTEERVDNSLVSRIENMGDIIANIDYKQCDLERIEEELDCKSVVMETFLKNLADSHRKNRTNMKWKLLAVNFKNGMRNFEKNEQVVYIDIVFTVPEREKEKGWSKSVLIAELDRLIRKTYPDDEANSGQSCESADKLGHATGAGSSGSSRCVVCSVYSKDGVSLGTEGNMPVLVKDSGRLRKLGVGIGIALCGSVIGILCDREQFFQLGPFRVVRAGATVLCIVADYKWTMWTCQKTDVSYHQKLSAAHSRSARKLLKLAKSNGGVYIKVGQHLASLEYLLPVEYTDALCVLHSRAPESRLGEVRQVLEEDLNAKLEDIFVDFNASPRGSASLAQVYRAVLRKNNEEVAVKVQHIHALTGLASRLFPDFHFLWLVDEMKRNLPRELDFRVEAANAKKLREMFSHLDYLKIPKIYEEYTTERVLTMEYCDGAQINDISYFTKNSINRYDICRKLGAVFSEMIFINGYVHCDPHPGNVLVNKEKDGHVSIILLDHGLYLTMESDFRIKYSKLWLALLKPDLNEVKECAQSMGVGDLYGLFACMITSRSWHAISQGIDKSRATSEEARFACSCFQREIKLYAATLIPEISQVLERMPRAMLLILKTNDLLRSIEYRLGTQGRADTFVQMARCCVRSVHRRSAEINKSLLIKVCIYVRMYLALFKITVFEYYLMFTNPFYAKPVES
uniref:ABC1 atypical kinase-like domain-containing protein n=1 Tax=Setaria digitata TaxID=48799 RepID=A0A915PQY3_9BILA